MQSDPTRCDASRRNAQPGGGVRAIFGRMRGMIEREWENVGMGMGGEGGEGGVRVEKEGYRSNAGGGRRWGVERELFEGIQEEESWLLEVSWTRLRCDSCVCMCVYACMCLCV